MDFSVIILNKKAIKDQILIMEYLILFLETPNNNIDPNISIRENSLNINNIKIQTQKKMNTIPISLKDNIINNSNQDIIIII